MVTPVSSVIFVRKSPVVVSVTSYSPSVKLERIVFVPQVSVIFLFVPGPLTVISKEPVTPPSHFFSSVKSYFFFVSGVLSIISTTSCLFLSALYSYYLSMYTVFPLHTFANSSSLGLHEIVL